MEEKSNNYNEIEKTARTPQKSWLRCLQKQKVRSKEKLANLRFLRILSIEQIDNPPAVN